MSYKLISHAAVKSHHVSDIIRLVLKLIVGFNYGRLSKANLYRTNGFRFLSEQYCPKNEPTRVPLKTVKILSLCSLDGTSKKHVPYMLASMVTP